MLSSNIMSYGIGDWNGHGFFTTQQRSRVYCYFHNNPYLQRMVKTSSRGKPTMAVEECLKSSKTRKLISGSAPPPPEVIAMEQNPTGMLYKSTKYHPSTRIIFKLYGYPKKKHILNNSNNILEIFLNKMILIKIIIILLN